MIDENIVVVKRPKHGVVEKPVVVSVPHAGTWIPQDLYDYFDPQIVASLPDTDFYVDKIYDWIPQFGGYLVVARCSRYVIDLNRDPEQKRLYQDHRQETSLVPTKTFSGQPLYRSPVCEPGCDEITRRKTLYFDPYYQVLRELLDDLRKRHGQVLFYDAHSIRRMVPQIAQQPFSDIILGTVHGSSAKREIIEYVREFLTYQTKYTVSCDQPFSGGYLTRFFANPKQGIHAIQIERSLDTYTTGSFPQLDSQKLTYMQSQLKNLFCGLLNFL